MDNIKDAVYTSEPQDHASIKYLTFQIDGQLYGISINNVVEIVQIQPVTEMPEFPTYAKGVLNLRGRVVPLIDVRLCFGKPEKAHNDRTCIVIVDIDGLHTGLIVDVVEDVLDIENNLISPPPAISKNCASSYVTGIAKLNGYMALLLDCRLLLADSDIGAFAQAVV